MMFTLFAGVLVMACRGVHPESVFEGRALAAGCALSWCAAV